MTPSEHGGLFTGALGKAKELKTAPTTFIIPTEIATNRKDVGKYAEQLEFCVCNGYSPDEFIERCRDEGLPITSESLPRGYTVNSSSSTKPTKMAYGHGS